MRIAIDAMGGDFVPANVLDGALIAGRRLGIGFTLVGPADLINRELERHRDTTDLDLSVVDALDVIGMSELPVKSL
jgi:glycerol-3-phosphate acyltransferase PlsX